MSVYRTIGPLVFTAMKNCSILHGRVFVMECTPSTGKLPQGNSVVRITDRPNMTSAVCHECRASIYFPGSSYVKFTLKLMLKPNSSLSKLTS